MTAGSLSHAPGTQPDPGGLNPLGLEFLSPEESLDFLRQTIPVERASGEELASLAERLGHLPLALELAARYLEAMHGLSVSGYLDRLDDLLADPAMAVWRADLGNPTGHELDQAGTFRLMWEQLSDDDARMLFLVTGYCAPNQPIPCELLETAHPSMKALDFRRRTGTPSIRRRAHVDLDKPLSILTRLGLLGVDDPASGPTIHPLLAGFARTLPGTGDALLTLIDALGSLAVAANEAGRVAPFFPLRPHVEAATTAAEAAGLEFTAILWNEFARHLQLAGDYTGARVALERALAFDEESVYGPNSIAVAVRAGNLGKLLVEIGDLEGARTAYERSLEIYLDRCDKSDPRVAEGHSSLGSVLRAGGHLAEARAAYERALEIYRERYGERFPLAAAAYDGLGGVLKAEGDLAGARAAYERALDIRRGRYGGSDSLVAAAYNKLGGVLKAEGDLAGARAAYESALDISLQRHGESDPRVLIASNNLGTVLHDQGDLAGARAAFKRVLRVFTRMLPSEHPHVATVQSNLGLVLKAQGDLAGARAALERALAIREAALGPDHHKTQSVRGNLADLDTLGPER